MATKSDTFKDFVLDQLADLQGLTCRGMFGGHGLSCRRKFFGIVHQGRLYFKVTAQTLKPYKDHGMTPFRPNTKQTLTSFYEVPVDVLEDAEALTAWAHESLTRITRLT